MSFKRIASQLAAVFAISISMTAGALAEAARGPATPEEQGRVIQLAKTSDSNPMGTMASEDGRWFEKWADDVPDYNFGPDKGAYWFVTGAAKGDLKRVMRFHHTVSTAAFQLQHHMADPMKNNAHMEAKTLAGVEGLLRAYESLLPKRSANRSEQLDEAVAARNRGALAEFVKALPPMPAR